MKIILDLSVSFLCISSIKGLEPKNFFHRTPPECFSQINSIEKKKVITLMNPLLICSCQFNVLELVLESLFLFFICCSYSWKIGQNSSEILVFFFKLLNFKLVYCK